MRGLLLWLRSRGLALLAFATLAVSLAGTAFVWDIRDKFAIKARALARDGSESASYMGIATDVMGWYVLPVLIVVSALALATFVATLRRGRAAAV